ncbi:MAG: isoaspartyl peptidase/L-asparaginase [Deltaproteobacteria bacterium]|nr:isoaspartyl peptidase/L-asparaginase [Deltaproteobacteria bacterium]
MDSRLMPWSIIVHGGAGHVPKNLELAHRAGCERAVAAGAAVLAAGGVALEAACAAVQVLEADPHFNAGHGGALDEDGLPALDAAVMRGSDLAYGAVAAVVGVSSPVRLARAILEDGRHCLLAGPSALRFARRHGVALIDPERQITEKTKMEWESRQAEVARRGPPPATAEWAPLDREGESRGNTVGAAVRDGQGTVAAATSTGGLLGRYVGRVGDSPIAGAGTYARDDLGAASATGHGETMLRTVFAYQTLLSLKGVGAPEALLLEALSDAKARVGGTGGVIVALPDGRIAHARNTPTMACAWQIEGSALGSAF